MADDSRTPILLRYGVWLALIWTLLILLVAIFYVWDQQHAYRQLAHVTAKRIVARDLLYRHWNARSGGVYVPVAPGSAPNPYLQHIPERDVVTPSGRTLTLVDPDQMSVQVGSLAAAPAVKVHLAALNPIRPENAADAWEAQGLKRFAEGERESSLFTMNGDERLYRFMQPLIVTADCLDCHATHGYLVGEVRGGYAISLPVGDLYEAYRRHVWIGCFGYFLLWGAGLGGGRLLDRRFNERAGFHRQDQEKLSAAEQNIHYLTYYDHLTALPNAHLFNERLQAVLAESSRSGQRLAVGVVGIDHYKRLKNTFGLEAGERLLQESVKRFVTALHPSDMLACLSEGRFLLLQPGLKGAEDVGKTVERMRKALKEPVNINGQEFFVSVSLGFALSPEDGSDARILIGCADAAFSRAKAHGRDSFQVYTPMLNRKALEQITLENTLRRALERKQLELFYQPQVDARNGRIIGAEALLRWRNPELGMVSPVEFIPLAEESGLILTIGEWALETACRDAAGWGESLGEPFKVSVNISPRQFQQADLIAMVDDSLAKSRLPSGCLVLEITEGSIIQNVERGVDVLRELKKRGLRIAIDDFGTGYSSLNYLKIFPLDQVKIDKTFVEEIQQKDSSNVIVTSIVNMAHKLGLEVVAEGVETEMQRDFLKSLGCHCMQGFYYCRPMEADKFGSLLRSLKDEGSECSLWWNEPALGHTIELGGTRLAGQTVRERHG